jgi:hypothetical protein
LLHVRPPTISHHRSRLAASCLVSWRGQGCYSMYHLETQAPERQTRRMLSRQDFAAVVHGLEMVLEVVTQAYTRGLWESVVLKM